ncbi:MAG: DUF58 domain-containing protein [bacterium]
MAKLILDPKFLHQLDSLRLLSKTSKKVYLQGERKEKRPGSGLEFIDYQEYQVGDDYRYIDWNLFSRLDQLFVKLFIEEESLRVFLVVDQSVSMSEGNPSKIDYACSLAAALGYIALANLDEVGAATFSSELEKVMPSRRGRSQAFRLFGFLERVSCRGRTNFNLSLDEFSRSQRPAGMTIIFSDLFDPHGYEEGLLALRTRGWEICLIQILEESELSPQEKGEVVLIDKETYERVDTFIDESILKIYQQRVANFLEGIEVFCQHYKIRYLRTLTSLPLSKLIFQRLRNARILK